MLHTHHLSMVTVWTGEQRASSQQFIAQTVVEAERWETRCECRLSQELMTPREFLCAMTIAQEAVVPNALQAGGQYMQEKATKEFLGAECHDFRLIVMPIVFPAEAHLAIVDTHQAMIGDRHAMGVAAELVQHLLWTTRGRFGVDDPFRSTEGREIRSECLWISYRENTPRCGVRVSHSLWERFNNPIHPPIAKLL